MSPTRKDRVQTGNSPKDREPTRSSESDDWGGNAFAIGTMVGDGRYRIDRYLGKGGMGEVYHAEDLWLGQGVALKFLSRPPYADGETTEHLLSRLREEVSIAQQINHPNICRVHDLCIDAELGLYFISMEYIDGEDLSSLLRRIGSFRPDRAAEIAQDVCRGLAAIHDKNILHRDLKPSNVMIDGRGRACITDFSLAQSAESRGAADGAGTPEYMPPEQHAGRETNEQSDIYPLGLIIYELFTGISALPVESAEEAALLHRMWSPSRPSRLVKGLNPLIDQTILRCLKKDPANRPSSAIEVANALNKATTRGLVRSWPFGIKWFSFPTIVIIIGLIAMIVANGYCTVRTEGAHAKNLEMATRRTLDFLNSQIEQNAHPEALNGQFDDFPDIRAQMLHIFGMLYLKSEQNNYAYSLLNDAYEIRYRLLGPDHLETAESATILAQLEIKRGELHRAVMLAESALQERRSKLSETDSRIGHSTYCLGTAMLALGRHGEAEDFFSEALEIYEHNRKFLNAAKVLNDLGKLDYTRGDLKNAIEYGERAVARYAQVFPFEDNYGKAVASANLAHYFTRSNQLDKAARIYPGALEILRRTAGENHPELGSALDGYAFLLERHGKIDEAELRYNEALKILELHYGNVHYSIAGPMENIALLELKGGNCERAEDLLRRAREIYAAHFEGDHQHKAMNLYRLGLALQCLGQRGESDQLEEAVRLLTEALKMKVRLNVAESEIRTIRQRIESMSTAMTKQAVKVPS
ncbi:MAG: tetratricopeptide repeat protein [bacterium]|nr:tetratricopeptide repeat protein [bacterium]